jgi:hypothetical protein
MADVDGQAATQVNAPATRSDPRDELGDVRCIRCLRASTRCDGPCAPRYVDVRCEVCARRRPGRGGSAPVLAGAWLDTLGRWRAGPLVRAAVRGADPTRPVDFSTIAPTRFDGRGVVKPAGSKAYSYAPATGTVELSCSSPGCRNRPRVNVKRLIGMAKEAARAGRHTVHL